MAVNADDFRRHYASLSDEALTALNRDELVESARECYDQEVAGRNLSRSAVAGEVPTPLKGDPPPEETLVLVEQFLFPDQAKLARALLEAAGIPCYLANEHTLSANWMWTNAIGGLRLLVPAEFLEEARTVLAANVSDDDLAAQAEAAAEPD